LPGSRQRAWGKSLRFYYLLAPEISKVNTIARNA